jgi:hypothetical protein
MPHPCACSALRRSAVRTSSSATAGGRARGSRNSPPAAGDDAPGHLGQAEGRVGARHHEVAGEHELGAAGQGEAAHRGDDRLGAGEADEAGEAALLGHELGGTPVAQGLEVGAGAEVRPGAGEDGDPDVGVGLDPPDRGVEGGRQARVDGVALLRTVQGQRGDVAVDLVADLVAHVPSSR